ncbi:MAG: hypothetical protein LBT79_02330 [Elusimicrobiota bacterium]|jgi:hypothetical protein|nr:hypothetical protein [Elusimicrobiota bacterium]
MHTIDNISYYGSFKHLGISENHSDEYTHSYMPIYTALYEKYNRLTHLTERNNLIDEDGNEIILSYESLNGVIDFLNNFKYVDKIDFEIYLNNDGVFVLQSDLSDTFFYAKIINNSDAYYNIYNKNKETDIIKRESLYSLFDDLEKYYV